MNKRTQGFFISDMMPNVFFVHPSPVSQYLGTKKGLFSFGTKVVP